jgi:hypothetical protein
MIHIPEQVLGGIQAVFPEFEVSPHHTEGVEDVEGVGFHDALLSPGEGVQ